MDILSLYRLFFFQMRRAPYVFFHSIIIVRKYSKPFLGLPKFLSVLLYPENFTSAEGHKPLCTSHQCPNCMPCLSIAYQMFDTYISESVKSSKTQRISVLYCLPSHSLPWDQIGSYSASSALNRWCMIHFPSKFSLLNSLAVVSFR